MGVKLLRCSRKAADAFVRGELGWQTLKARRVMLRLRYWGKLVRMDEDRLAKVYRESRRDHDSGEMAQREHRSARRTMVKNWCSYTHHAAPAGGRAGGALGRL